MSIFQCHPCYFAEEEAIIRISDVFFWGGSCHEVVQARTEGDGTTSRAVGHSLDLHHEGMARCGVWLSSTAKPIFANHEYWGLLVVAKPLDLIVSGIFG